MKINTSFYAVINLCISNKGNLATFPSSASFLAVGVLRLLKKKGFVSFFQKNSGVRAGFSFKIFP